MDVLERVKSILAGEEDLERGIGTNEQVQCEEGDIQGDTV